MLQRGFHALDEGLRFVLPGILQQYHELVAAVARGKVLGTHGGLEHLAHVADHGVARGMAGGVVDALEMVYVEQQQRRSRMLGRPHAPQFAGRGDTLF